MFFNGIGSEERQEGPDSTDILRMWLSCHYGDWPTTIRTVASDSQRKPVANFLQPVSLYTIHLHLIRKKSDYLSLLFRSNQWLHRLPTDFVFPVKIQILIHCGFVLAFQLYFQIFFVSFCVPAEQNYCSE